MNKGALIVVTWLLLFAIISAIAADHRGKQINLLEAQIESLKLENQILKDELKPYQEAKHISSASTPVLYIEPVR